MGVNESVKTDDDKPDYSLPSRVNLRETPREVKRHLRRTLRGE